MAVGLPRHNGALAGVSRVQQATIVWGKKACRKIKKQQGDDLQTSDLWSVALYNDRATMILQLVADGWLDAADR